MSVRGKDADARRPLGADHAALEHDGTADPNPDPERIEGLSEGASLSGVADEHGEIELRRIDVRRIAAYGRSPRRMANPVYVRLKAAIRRDGPTQPLAVTRRPNAAGYVLWGGGGTRLTILKELATEPDGAHFAVVPCLLRPWRGEADLLLSHIKENELRGAIAFVDLAAAVVDLRGLLEREEGAAFDQRRFARRLGALGFDIDCGTISLATYAADRLSAALPLAVHGLRRSDIESTRCLDRAARALWKEWLIDAAAEYNRVFLALCARYDGPGWALSDLRRALTEEIAVRGDRTAQAVALELQARLSRFRSSEDHD